ncbi:MAG: hypothetical protein RIE06_27495 [Roseibium album]|uniref:hypothetical protein n=1 Tax=Roseibium album TaxID=311410 RepID=UPI0032EF9ECD
MRLSTDFVQPVSSTAVLCGKSVYKPLNKGGRNFKSWYVKQWRKRAQHCRKELISRSGNLEVLYARFLAENRKLKDLENSGAPVELSKRKVRDLKKKIIKRNQQLGEVAKSYQQASSKRTEKSESEKLALRRLEKFRLLPLDLTQCGFEEVQAILEPAPTTQQGRFDKALKEFVIEVDTLENKGQAYHKALKRNKSVAKHRKEVLRLAQSVSLYKAAVTESASQLEEGEEKESSRKRVRKAFERARQVVDNAWTPQPASPVEKPRPSYVNQRQQHNALSPPVSPNAYPNQSNEQTLATRQADQKHALGSSFDTSLSTRTKEPESHFEELFSTLSEPSSWYWSPWLLFMKGLSRLESLLAFIRSGKRVKTAIYSLPSKTYELILAIGQWGEDTAGWLNAHVRHGIMNRGRGEFYGAIKEATAERDKHLGTFNKLNKAPLSDCIQVGDLAEQVDAIHDDMHKTIAHLEQFYGIKYEASDAQNSTKETVEGASTDLLSDISSHHIALFKGVELGNVSSDAITKARLVSRRLVRLAEFSNARKNWRGQRNNIAQQSEVSALIAQLIMDQATISTIAFKMAKPEAAKEISIPDTMDLRENSHLQLLRKAGFRNLKNADRVLRSISYMSNGLANKEHKLNKVLFDNSPVKRRDDIAKYYAGVIMSMSEQEDFKLNGGWLRGLAAQYVFVGSPKYTPGSYIGSTANLTIEQVYDYGLKFRKVDGGLEITFSRAGEGGIKAQLSAWAGGSLRGGLAKAKNWIIPGGSLNLSANRVRSNENALTMTISDKDPKKTKAFVEGLFSGEVMDPFALMRKADKFNLSHNKKNTFDVELSPTGEVFATRTAEPGKSWQLQQFRGPLTSGFVFSLFKRESEKGHTYSSNDGIYNDTKSHKNVFFSKLSVWSSLLKPMLRIRAGQEGDGPIADDFSGGARHGLATTANGGHKYKYELERKTPGSESEYQFLTRKTWREWFFRTHKPYFGDVRTIKGKDEKITSASWNMMLPRNKRMLDAPEVTALIGKEPSTARSGLINALSFTTSENRTKIEDRLDRLKRDRSDLATDIDKMKSRIDFIDYKDRFIFQRKVRNILKKTKEGTGAHNIAQELLKLTDPASGAWRAWRRGETITVAMKADSRHDPATLNSASGNVDEVVPEDWIKEKIKEKPGEFGRMTVAQLTDSREASTSLSWPLVLKLGSTAKMEMTVNRKYPLE